MIRLSDELLSGIRDHARADYPYECCGAMLGTEVGGLKEITELRPVENVHEDGHERRFLISARDMFLIEREARAKSLNVLGFYHSHPDHPARPSEYDREHAWPYYSYVIVSVMKGEPADMTSWTLAEGGLAFDAEEIQS